MSDNTFTRLLKAANYNAGYALDDACKEIDVMSADLASETRWAKQYHEEAELLRATCKSLADRLAGCESYARNGELQAKEIERLRFELDAMPS